MNYRIIIAPEADKILRKYKKSNPARFKKLSALLIDISEHPRTGLGHPEPLKGGEGITYSRRISGPDRIIYDIYEDRVEVYVLDLEGHYDDK